MANFHQIAFPEDGAIGGGLAEEVDSEAGRNSKRDNAQLGENGDVEGHVRHCHQDRPRYSAAWAKFVDGDLVADGRCPVADRLDNTSRLGELPAEKVGDFPGSYDMTSLGGDLKIRMFAYAQAEQPVAYVFVEPVMCIRLVVERINLDIALFLPRPATPIITQHTDLFTLRSTVSTHKSKGACDFKTQAQMAALRFRRLRRRLWCHSR